MTSEGDLWRSQRYMMQPSFHRKVITGFAELLAQANDRFIERWEGLARRGELVNVTEEMSELTLEIVLRSILGIDHDRLTVEHGANPFEVVAKDTGAQSRSSSYSFRFARLKILPAIISRAASRGSG